jgi:hypothetical protein
MFNSLRALLLVLVTGSMGLQAQFVEIAKPSQGKKSSGQLRTKGTHPKGDTTKLLDKKLADFGITQRSLATWKTTGGKPTLVFYDISFKKVGEPNPGYMERPLVAKALMSDGFNLNGFEVQGADYLANESGYRHLALIRLNKNAPQGSKDSGKTWVDGERIGETWIFAFDNETLALSNADEAFRPTEFKAWALERSAVTKQEMVNGYPTFTPYFHSAVVAVAIGKNEMQGLIKFPGTTFVSAFRGIRFKDKWVARSLDKQPLNTYLADTTSGGVTYRGSRALKTDGLSFYQIEIMDESIQIGSGWNFINYGQESSSAEQLRTAMEFNLAKAHLLPDMAAAYKANLGRSLWTKSDEDGSFSREAEQAYVKCGLPVWFYAPQGNDAVAALKPMLDRIKRTNGRIEFIPSN